MHAYLGCRLSGRGFKSRRLHQFIEGLSSNAKPFLFVYFWVATFYTSINWS
jgi:hypothetical protein